MSRSMRVPASLVLIVGVGISACSGEKREAADTAAPDTSAAAPAGDQMAGMAQMAGGDMSAQVRAHMQMMEGMRGDSLRAMLPMHRQMAANMLSDFNRQMAAMKMETDPRWKALADSVRSDLARMPSLSAAELERTIASHHARIMRLLEMHRAMM